MKIMCDIDGCLADIRELYKRYLQGKKDWDEYYKHQMECPVIKPILSIINDFRYERNWNELIFMTGRPESVRSDTENYIRMYVPSYDKLLMRQAGDTRPTKNIKYPWLIENSPNLVIDDDSEVVEMATQMGFTVLQVHGYRCGNSRDYVPGENVP